jgi:hypothetical protein
MISDLELVELANPFSQPPYRSTTMAIIDKIRADIAFKKNNLGEIMLPHGSSDFQVHCKSRREKPLSHYNFQREGVSH